MPLPSTVSSPAGAVPGLLRRALRFVAAAVDAVRAVPRRVRASRPLSPRPPRQIQPALNEAPQATPLASRPPPGVPLGVGRRAQGLAVDPGFGAPAVLRRPATARPASHSTRARDTASARPASRAGDVFTTWHIFDPALAIWRSWTIEALRRDHDERSATDLRRRLDRLAMRLVAPRAALAPFRAAVRSVPPRLGSPLLS